MTEPVDVMVISAHPDDAEFGVAGSVARWTGDSKAVVYVVCTSGDKGTADPGLTPSGLAAVREEEQKAAAAIVGVREVVFLRIPDQGVEDTHEFRRLLVRMIRLYRPGVVVTSDPYRRYLSHRDHRIVGQVALDAVYPYARDHLAYPDLLREGLGPHKVREMLFWGSEAVNYRSDITATFDKKLAALLCHTSQVKEWQTNIKEWLYRRCRQMAEGEDFELAEAFHRVEIPPLGLP